MLLTCKNFNNFRWAQVIDMVLRKYLVKIIRNFTFERGLIIGS